MTDQEFHNQNIATKEIGKIEVRGDWAYLRCSPDKNVSSLCRDFGIGALAGFSVSRDTLCFLACNASAAQAAYDGLPCNAEIPAETVAEIEDAPMVDLFGGIGPKG